MKAWELKNLIDRLKARGLSQAEAVLKVFAAESLDWASESLMLSEKPYLKFCGPMVAGAKPLLLQQLDKIDGKIEGVAAPAVSPAAPSGV